MKGDLREARGHLDLLNSDVHRVDMGLGESRAEFRFAKWPSGILLAMTISGIGGGIWQLATLTANVNHLEKRSEERTKILDARIDKLESTIDARIDKLDARIDKLDTSIEKLAASISQLLVQSKPKP